MLLQQLEQVAAALAVAVEIYFRRWSRLVHPHPGNSGRGSGCNSARSTAYPAFFFKDNSVFNVDLPFVSFEGMLCQKCTITK